MRELNTSRYGHQAITRLNLQMLGPKSARREFIRDMARETVVFCVVQHPYSDEKRQPS
jgi:hypothetical protein